MSVLFFLAAAGVVTAPLPLSEPATWISADDYPSAAIRGGKEGSVTVVLAINVDGVAEGCAVKSSSGDQKLDLLTCNLLKSRAKFKPARDGQGKPVRSEYVQRARWAIPMEKLTEQGSIISYSIGENGRILGCSIKYLGNYKDSDIKCGSFQNEDALSSIFGEDLSSFVLIDVSLKFQVIDPQSILIADKFYDVRKIISQSVFDVSSKGIITQCTTKIAVPMFGRKYDMCDGIVQIGSRQFEPDANGRAKQLDVTFDFSAKRR